MTKAASQLYTHHVTSLMNLCRADLYQNKTVPVGLVGIGHQSRLPSVVEKRQIKLISPKLHEQEPMNEESDSDATTCDSDW